MVPRPRLLDARQLGLCLLHVRSLLQPLGARHVIPCVAARPSPTAAPRQTCCRCGQCWHGRTSAGAPAAPCAKGLPFALALGGVAPAPRGSCCASLAAEGRRKVFCTGAMRLRPPAPRPVALAPRTAASSSGGTMRLVCWCSLGHTAARSWVLVVGCNRCALVPKRRRRGSMLAGAPGGATKCVAAHLRALLNPVPHRSGCPPAGRPRTRGWRERWRPAPALQAWHGTQAKAGCGGRQHGMAACDA